MIIDTLLPERPARISLSHMNRTSDDRQGVASGGRRGGQSARHRRLMPYLGAAAVTAVALALALLIDAYLFVANVVLVFLGGVVLCAIRWGMRPALFACLLSVLALNFFLFPPIHDFRVQDPENVVAVVVFVAVAVFVGRLTAKARAAAALADRRAKANEHLYGFAGRLAGVSDLDDLLHVTARQISDSIAVDAVVLLLEQQVLNLRAAVPPLEDLSSEDFAKAQDALTGASASIMNPPGGYLFLPMRSAGGSVGVIGVRRDRSAANLSEEERRLTEAMADQAATAIERLTLNADVERARITAETESLRSAMLSAISHDLKTPLAAILGAATSLGSYNSYFEQQGRNELVATIREEAERMSRFVVNLLDITRVESGTLEVRNEATDIGEVIGAAARRARQILGDHRLLLRIAPDLPLLDLDGVILEQTLFNLLDNAAKYSPPLSTITIEARRAGTQIVIRVLDEGPGIPPPDVQRIFEKFYRSAAGGKQRAGTGLGLAICRGFVEVMGGRIIAGNRTDRTGALFMIGFPLPEHVMAPQLPRTADDD